MHRAHITALAALLLFLSGTARAVDPDFREDPERLHRKWDERIPAAEWRHLLRTTGMADALAHPARSGGAWSPLGPFGTVGTDDRNGRISGLQIESTLGGAYRIWAGACQGGLWTSTSSNPDSWTDLSTTLPHPAARSFSVRPSNFDDIVVATGEFNRAGGGGFFRTINGGASWTDVSPSTVPDGCYRMLRHATDESLLLVAATAGLYRSTDAGNTWARTSTGDWTDLAAHPTDANRVFACRRGTGILSSTDFGANWTFLSDPSLPVAANWGRASVAICRNSPDFVVLVVEDGGFGMSGGTQLGGAFRSTDGGATWTDVTGTLSMDQSFHTCSVAIRPDDPDDIFIGMDDLARSTDGGATWMVGESEHAIDIGHSDLTQIRFDPATGADVMWLCNDGGIYRWDFGTNALTALNGTGSTALRCSEIDFVDVSRSVLALGLQDNGILRSTDRGSSWHSLSSGDGAGVAVTDPLAHDVWFTHGVFTTAPKWRISSWSDPGPAVFTNNPDKYQPRLLFERDRDRVWTMDGTTLYSSPASGTASWTARVADLQADDYNIRDFIGSPVDGRTFWVNYWSGNERDLTMARDTPGGWDIRHSENLAPAGGSVISTSPSPQWPDEAWVAMGGPAGQPKILHTTDGGVSFQDRTGNLDQLPRVWNVAPHPFSPIMAYAGTDLGVFRTTDAGATWEPFQTGMPAAKCRNLRFALDENAGSQHRLVAATDGRGVWQRTITSPPVLWVDPGAPGGGDGSREFPLNTLAAALSAAPPGAIVALRGDTYQVPQLTQDDVLVTSWYSRAEWR